MACQYGLQVSGFTDEAMSCRKFQIALTETLLCLASGNGPLPLVSDMIESIPVQQEKKGFGRGRLVVDDWCRLKGTDGIFSIGDCSVIDEKPLPPNAQV